MDPDGLCLPVIQFTSAVFQNVRTADAVHSFEIVNIVISEGRICWIIWVGKCDGLIGNNFDLECR